MYYRTSLGDGLWTWSSMGLSIWTWIETSLASYSRRNTLWTATPITAKILFTWKSEILHDLSWRSNGLKTYRELTESSGKNIIRSIIDDFVMSRHLFALSKILSESLIVWESTPRDKANEMWGVTGGGIWRGTQLLTNPNWSDKHWKQICIGCYVPSCTIISIQNIGITMNVFSGHYLRL